MSKFFSLAPWTSMYIKPNGNVYPCESVGWLEHENFCAGNIEHNSIEEMLNHPAYRQMRLDVLNTNHCAIQDGQSGLEIGCTYLQLRELYNTDINYYREHTSATGEFNSSLQTLYIERSNICNLTCVYCNPLSSNSWAKLKNETSIKRISDEIYWPKIAPHLNNLKEINISGGEPVLDPFTEKMLDHLLIHNNQVQINMTTNLTYDMNKKASFFDKLNSFARKPKIACSIDSKENLFEAIRRNSSWPLVLENLNNLKKYGNIYTFFCIAVSALNCFSLRSFHEFLLKEELASIDTIRYQPVCSPEFLSIRSLSLSKKKSLMYYLLIYAEMLSKKEAQSTQPVDLWCNGGKPLSQAVRNLAEKYLYNKTGDETFLDKLSDIPKEILAKANLL
jgi:sulfatase maturation enzyme AslB (radical SAM superfamily)